MIPHAFSSSSSQASFVGLKSPVPVAIAMAQFASPASVIWSHSAGDIHCFTAENFRCPTRLSHRNFAGQKEVRIMQPVRACVSFSGVSSRSAAASSRHRESAQVKMRVIAEPRASQPMRLCQKQETPTPAIGRPRRFGSVR